MRFRIAAACLLVVAAALPGTRSAAASYEIHWGPMLVADGRLGTEPGPWGQRVSLEVQTRSVLDWIYRLQYRGEAELDLDGASLHTRLVRDRNGRMRETRIEWQRDGVEVREEKRRPGRDPSSKQYRYEGSDWTGPFAFLQRAASHPWKAGELQRIDVVTGDDRWRIDLACARQRTLRLGDEEHQAWEIDAIAAEWEGEVAPEPQAGEGWIQDVKLFVAAEGTPEILELRVRTSVGLVRARRLPDGDAVAGASLARRPKAPPSGSPRSVPSGR